MEIGFEEGRNVPKEELVDSESEHSESSYDFGINSGNNPIRLTFEELFDSDSTIPYDIRKQKPACESEVNQINDKEEEILSESEADDFTARNKKEVTAQEELKNKIRNDREVIDLT
eukprot:TRINITY_DN15470_c0_g1_i1.p1 TRINITY_DN15470_c0_g1~~TRINITY_DN15470_c0_g1_i1.p1  ORF type:complete len:127 (-),score=34.12 TRINITY_DN15470_c0_g1_i1:9-356(-)